MASCLGGCHAGSQGRMTPSDFCTAAEAIAGPRWRTCLGPKIGKCRTQVWEYANGKRPVPETVRLLMNGLQNEKTLRDLGFRPTGRGTWEKPV
jgi:hypothetical protein